jgi:hypothetical protein
MKLQINRVFGGVLVFLGFQFAGCARIDAVATHVLTSGMGAVAVVNDQVLTGKLRLFPDRTGDVVLQKDKPEPDDLVTHCRGRVRFTSSTQGSIDLRCNNGIDSALSFAMVGDISGYAMGSSMVGEVTMTFGLDDAEALSYLRVAPPKKLILNPETDAIEVQ